MNKKKKHWERMMEKISCLKERKRASEFHFND
jgi:hypothetical protein